MQTKITQEQSWLSVVVLL